MLKNPMLARSASALFPALLITALIAVSTGCGSDSPADTPPPSGRNPPSSEPIEGVAMPSSVALVTATNAQ